MFCFGVLLTIFVSNLKHHKKIQRKNKQPLKFRHSDITCCVYRLTWYIKSVPGIHLYVSTTLKSIFMSSHKVCLYLYRFLPVRLMSEVSTFEYVCQCDVSHLHLQIILKSCHYGELSVDWQATYTYTTHTLITIQTFWMQEQCAHTAHIYKMLMISCD